MEFNPDAYLAGDFNPDEYLGSFNPDEYLGAQKEPNAFLDIASSLPFALGKQAQGVKQAFGDIIGDADMAANAAAARAQIEAEEKKVAPKFESSTAQGLYEGVKSTTQAIPALAAGMINPALGVGMISAQSGSEAYGKYRGRGATPGEAGTGAALEGTIEGATEALPLGFILKRLGKEGFTNFVKGLLIREVPGEQVATLLQDAVDTAIANPNKTWEQYRTERPEAAYKTLLATGVQTGLMGAAGIAGAAATRKGPGQADDVKSNLDNLDKVKEETKRTQGEGTLYVGKDGSTTPELPVKIQEDQGQLDLARTELQNNLQREATKTEEPVQGELFLEEPQQQNLDLVTKVNEPEAVTNEAPTKFSDTALGGPKFTPKDLQTYTLANGTVQTTPEALLKWGMSKVDAKDDLSLILPRVMDMLSQFQGKHGVSIELLDKPRTKLDNVPAYYSGNENKIYLGQDGMTVRVATHEIVHGLTHRFIEASPNHPAVKQLQIILDALKTNEKTKDQYGSTDLHELVAEGFSSRVFKDRLMQIGTDLKSGNFQNAWDVFVDSIAQLMGITAPHERTALAKVLESATDISKAYSKQKIEIDKKYMEMFKKNELPIQKSRIAEKLNAVTNGAMNAAEGAQSPPKIQDADTVKSDTLKSLTGEEWIPRDPEVTPELLDKISKEPDGSSTWALTPGALARSELAKSTLVKTIYRLMDNAYKRADLFATRTVAPVEKTFSKILRNDQHAKISHDLIMRELGNGKEYITEELRAAGVPEPVVMAHLEFRAMMQQALEIQNKVLRDKGLPPVRPIDAYMSARWSGPWRANIRDSEGKIIWQIAEHSRGAAKQAMEYIKSKEPNLVFEDIKFKQGRDRGDRVEAGYLDMLKLLDKDDPRIQTLQSIYEDYVLGKTENVTAQEKHFMRKTGVKGFAGSRPWSKTDAKDMLVQQFQYAKNAARWAETQLPMEKVNTLLNDPNLQESQKNNIAFSKEYTKGQLGFGTKSVFEAIDNSLAKAFGTSPQKLQEYMGAAKTVFYLKTLGLSVPFTITQFLQPAITTPAWHSKLSGEGFKHNPVLTTLNSIAKGGAGASWHYARVMGNEGQMKLAEKMLNDVELDAVKYMEANSVVEINPLSDIKRNLRPAGVKGVAAPFEFTIRHSELIARSMAFMGYVSHLQQSGKYDTSTKEGRMKLFQQAEDMTKISMTDYRPQERALLFERGGLTGDAAATLHSYQINNLAQLTKFSKMALDGDAKPLVMMIGMQAMAAGLTGLWFVEDLDDLWENLKKLLPHDEYLKVKDLSIKNFILDNFGETAAYGLASAASGTNIHTRMNASDQIPVWPFEPQLNMESLTDLAPFLESSAAIGDAAITGLNPNATEQEKMAALYKAAPAGAQGPMENLPAFNQGATSLNTKDLTLGEYRRTPEEKNLRNFGFRSPEEQKFKDKKWTLSKVEQQLQQRMSTAGKKATQFVISGDMAKANRELEKYSELGGDVEALVNGLSKAQLNRLTVELERRAMTAESGSLPAIMKLKRYLDVYGDQTNR